MQTMVIPIHSTVDLITNSSSEIYIQATTKTVAVWKDIINDLLKFSGDCHLTADDLFEFDLVLGVYAEYDDDETGKSVDASEKSVNSPEGKQYMGYHNDEFDYEISVKITPKVDSDEAKKICALVQSLIGTYNIESVYN